MSVYNSRTNSPPLNVNTQLHDIKEESLDEENDNTIEISMQRPELHPLNTYLENKNMISGTENEVLTTSSETSVEHPKSTDIDREVNDILYEMASSDDVSLLPPLPDLNTEKHTLLDLEPVPRRIENDVNLELRRISTHTIPDSMIPSTEILEESLPESNSPNDLSTDLSNALMIPISTDFSESEEERAGPLTSKNSTPKLSLKKKFSNVMLNNTSINSSPFSESGDTAKSTPMVDGIAQHCRNKSMPSPSMKARLFSSPSISSPRLLNLNDSPIQTRSNSTITLNTSSFHPKWSNLFEKKRNSSISSIGTRTRKNSTFKNNNSTNVFAEPIGIGINIKPVMIGKQSTEEQEDGCINIGCDNLHYVTNCAEPNIDIPHEDETKTLTKKFSNFIMHRTDSLKRIVSSTSIRHASTSKHVDDGISPLERIQSPYRHQENIKLNVSSSTNELHSKSERSKDGNTAPILHNYKSHTHSHPTLNLRSHPDILVLEDTVSREKLDEKGVANKSFSPIFDLGSLSSSNSNSSSLKEYIDVLLKQQREEDRKLELVEQKFVTSGWCSQEELTNLKTKRMLINEQWAEKISFYQDKL